MAINGTPEPLARLGLQSVINAHSWVTFLGGSIMPPEVLQAMSESANCFVNMPELNRKAGEIIAEITGADAGLVTAGCAAALVLQAAACMTGLDEDSIRQLPNTTGMKNEIIIQSLHRNHYDNAYRMAGATLIEIGGIDSCSADELESAMNDNTAAVAFVWNACKETDIELPLSRVLELAHSRSIPVVLDAAAELPPAANLTKFVDMGVDLVAFSGGKGMRGPQSTGILAGRRDLMEAAWENAFSFDKAKAGIGRSMKVCKEEVVGLITALELFVSKDHEAEWAEWYAKSETVRNSLVDISGLDVHIDDSGYRQGPVLIIKFKDSWRGPSIQRIKEKMERADPPIYLAGSDDDGELLVIPVNVQDGEEDIIAKELRAVLLSAN